MAIYVLTKKAMAKPTTYCSDADSYLKSAAFLAIGGFRSRFSEFLNLLLIR